MSCRGRRTGDNHQVMRGRHGEEGRGERWRAAAMLCRRRAEKAAGEPSVGPALAAPLWRTWSYFAMSASAEHEGVERVFWEGPNCLQLTGWTMSMSMLGRFAHES